MGRQKLVIKKANTVGDDQFYGVIIGGNGEPMYTSETEHNKADIISSFRSLQRNVLFARIVDETTWEFVKGQTKKSPHIPK